MNEPSEPLCKYRRFNLGDAMIVVAAAAVCSALGRAYILPNLRSVWWPEASAMPSPPPGGVTLRMPLPFDLLSFAIAVSESVIEVLAIWFCAFAVMRLRQPRPPLRVVALQPGMMGFSAAAASVVVAYLVTIVSNQIGGLVVGMLTLDLAVPVAWLQLARTGCWRPEPSWTDRLGRVLGVSWWAAFWVSSGLIAVAIARG